MMTSFLKPRPTAQLTEAETSEFNLGEAWNGSIPGFEAELFDAMDSEREATEAKTGNTPRGMTLASIVATLTMFS